MRSHITWCLVVALNVLVTGTKVPRQIVYQIRPAPLSAFNSHDGTFLLDDGVTEFQFPTFGLKTAAETRTVKAYAPPPAPSLPVVTSLTSAANDSADADSSAGTSSSAGLSGENSSAAVTREEITEVPRFGSSQVRQQYLTLQPEQFQQIFQQVQPQQQYFQQVQPQQQIFQQIQPQQQQQQQIVQQAPQTVDVGPQYEYKSMEDPNTINSEDIKTAQTEVITEDRLQPAYSERREKRRRKDKEQEQPPGDASYAFGYETDEAARHEVADPDGNVKGWYTYVDDEGTVRKIIYTAGAGKGFVILGKEKVRGPGAAAPPQSRKHKSSSRKGNSDYGYSADSSTYSSIKSQKGASTPPSLTNYFNNWNDLAKAGTSNPPQPTTIVATADQPTRTKKPVFIVKIKRPVKGQFFTKPVLSDPEPLPLPVTPIRSSRTRRRPVTLSDVVPSLRKSRIKKYPTPPIYYADDEDESGYDQSSSSGQASASASSSSSSAEDSEHEESREQQRGGGSGLSVKSDPDSSYVFGYETDTANRLEKADPYGNVRGSYSYIDPEGTKRTVHYIAGGNTGFQVIHASPSITRGVRLEAPPGYVVKRVPSLRTSESRFPIPISVPQPSAIVYHIHPDGGWKPWEPTLRKKKIKIHRKKLPKSFFENAQRDGIVLLQTHPDNVPISRSSSPSISVGNVGSSSTNAYFKEKVTAAGSGQVTATETRYPGISMSAPVSRRRHAPQRGYTAEHHLVQIDDSDSKEQIHPRQYLSPQLNTKSSSPSSSSMSTSTQSATTVQAVHEREPLLYSPTFETVRDRMPIPNPIQLLPTQVAVKNKGAPTQSAQPGLDTSSSNHHAVAFTSDGKLQVDVPTVVIEAIEANSPSSSSLTTIKKDENKNAAPHTHTVYIHNRLPEAAALTQSTPPPRPSQVVVTKTSSSSSSNPNTIITVIQPTTRPNYEISSASASSTGYKYHHLQNHHYKPNPVTIPTPPPTPVQYSPTTTIVVHKQQSAQPVANQLSSGGHVPTSPTPPPTRSRRRHHRSKTVTTSAPTSPSAPPSPSTSASSYSSNAIRAGGGVGGGASNSGGNTETTTMMSSSKRLINRLAATDNDLAVSA